MIQTNLVSHSLLKETRETVKLFYINILALKLIELRRKYRLGTIFYILSALVVNIAISPHLSATEEKKFLSSEALDQVVIESDRQSTDNSGDVFTAFGNVRITFPAKGIFAKSQQVQYLRKEQIIVLTGDVELEREGQESLHGERIVYFLDDDQLVADSSADNQVLLKLNLHSDNKKLGASSL